MRPGDARSVEWRVDVKVARDAAAIRSSAPPPFTAAATSASCIWCGRRRERSPKLFRRAKLQLDAVPAAMIEAALKSATGEIVAELDLTDAKGGPHCAPVRPPAIRWSLPPR